MKVIDTEISGVKIIVPGVFGDVRGWFCETYNAGFVHGVPMEAVKLGIRPEQGLSL